MPGGEHRYCPGTSDAENDVQATEELHTHYGLRRCAQLGTRRKNRSSLEDYEGVSRLCKKESRENKVWHPRRWLCPAPRDGVCCTSGGYQMGSRTVHGQCSRN